MYRGGLSLTALQSIDELCSVTGNDINYIFLDLASLSRPLALCRPLQESYEMDLGGWEDSSPMSRHEMSE
jgi:hypothetical protein